MDFGKYPFDRHTCQFIVFIERGASIVTEMKDSEFGYAFKEYQNTMLDYDIDFESLPMSSINTYQSYPNMPEVLKKQTRRFGHETFSCAGFAIKLIRHSKRVIFIYYLPSSMFVLTSWASFLIPPKVSFIKYQRI